MEDIQNKIREQEEEKMINNAFQTLLDSYLASKHRKKVEIITKAFNFAKQAHKGVRRRSGEPYIMHPIAVAQIVCQEIGLGSTSICSALLHDVVEDTDYTVEDISNIFGPKIAQIVDGLTKISGGIFGDKASSQAENFKKLLLTMSEDIRVILIKIADRLHNMRTLGSMLPSKQYKIAGETLYIYAPLANRLGLNKIKSELENLSFKYEHPDTYKEISDKLQATQNERRNIFENFINPIKKKLDEKGFIYRIEDRIKTPYSIWNKMQTKHVAFEEIYDILAVRIIFTPLVPEEELNECFDIYVSMSKIYKSHPDRLRDWISHPKANGYQALHTTLMSPHGDWIEVQIRSERMNDVAEHGFAAHWKYKEGGGSEDEGELDKWLYTIKEILDDPQPDAMDFLDTIKLNLFASEIFVFTPKGEIKTMPQNSTALDFAFTIHSSLGSHCIGAKVNHKLVPLSHPLKSGDQVEIISSKSQHVTPAWLNFATTAKAKSKITAILRKEQRMAQKNGEERLTEFLANAEMEVSTIVIEKLCKYHELASKEQLFAAIGSKKIILSEEDLNVLREKTNSTNVWKKYLTFPFPSSNRNKKDKKDDVSKPKINPKDIDRKKTLEITDDTIQDSYVIADCCKPIPGDNVLGYIDDNNQIVIHKRQCPVASRLKSSFGNRILDARWNTRKKLYFPVSLQLEGIDGVGVLNAITEVISRQMNVNIHRLSFETNDGIFVGNIKLYVHDVDDVTTICRNLKLIEQVKSVGRVDQ